MRSATPSRKSSFFWQAVLILLPVGVLTVVGLLSLRQDRLLAEQEAREHCAAIARQWAQGISDETVRQLRNYRNVNVELNFCRTADLGFSQWTKGAEEKAALEQVRTWQQANPGIDLSALPVADGVLNLRGELCVPQIYPLSPQPPDWLGKLSPEQLRLWCEEQAAEFGSGEARSALTAITNFLATKPPDGARANAEYHRLLLQTSGMAPEEAVARLEASARAGADELSEAGLPVDQLIYYQAMRRLPERAGVPYKLFRDVAWAICNRASILAPRLIAEAEQLNAAGPTNAVNRVPWLKSWWDADERTRQILRVFQDQHPVGSRTNALFWVTASGANCLLLPAYGMHETQADAGDPSSDGSSAIYRLWIFPESVVDMALTAATAKAEVSVPPYAVAGLEIGGRELVWQRNRFVRATNPPPLPVLGEAAGFLSDVSSQTNAHHFHLRILLADRQALYARQQQRTLWFAALILISTFAALAGLLAAHRAFRRQQQLNELKSNFVSSVSHELRAPLASVRLMAENLEGGRIPEPVRQREYYQFIVQECRRLSSLVENVLDFSRIEQGRKQYEFEPTDVLKLTQTTVSLLAPYAREKGVALRLDTGFPSDQPATGTPPSAPGTGVPPDRLPLELNVDGRALQQALVNLLDNAIKHSARGETVTVGLARVHPGTVSERRPRPPKPLATAGSLTGFGRPNLPGESSVDDPSGTVIHLWVADHGPGIPAAEQERIFERFYRLGSELRRETQGIGIGLSIVKHIMTAHGGRVLVDSQPGRGSRFTLELPGGRGGGPSAKGEGRRDGRAL